MDFFGATARIQDLVATDMRADFIQRQQRANEAECESFKTTLVDPETGRHTYLIALERWLTDSDTYLSWAALPFTPDGPHES